MVLDALVTTRNCGVKPGARVEMASLMMTPEPTTSA
jgi:hypothetical protein